MTSFSSTHCPFLVLLLLVHGEPPQGAITSSAHAMTRPPRHRRRLVVTAGDRSLLSRRHHPQSWPRLLRSAGLRPPRRGRRHLPGEESAGRRVWAPEPAKGFLAQALPPAPPPRPSAAADQTVPVSETGTPPPAAAHRRRAVLLHWLCVPLLRCDDDFSRFRISFDSVYNQL